MEGMPYDHPDVGPPEREGGPPRVDSKFWYLRPNMILFSKIPALSATNAWF